MFVREAMSRRVATVSRSTATAAATRLMQDQDLLAVAVMDGQALVTVLTPASLAHGPKDAASSHRKVGQEQGHSVAILAPDDLLSSALPALQSTDAIGLVVDHTDVVGILTASMVPPEDAEAGSSSPSLDVGGPGPTGTERNGR